MSWCAMWRSLAIWSKPSMQADKGVTMSGLTGVIMPCSGALQGTRALRKRGHLKRHAPTILVASWLHLGHVYVEAQGASTGARLLPNSRPSFAGHPVHPWRGGPCWPWVFLCLCNFLFTWPCWCGCGSSRWTSCTTPVPSTPSSPRLLAARPRLAWRTAAARQTGNPRTLQPRVVGAVWSCPHHRCQPRGSSACPQRWFRFLLAALADALASAATASCWSRLR